MAEGLDAVPTGRTLVDGATAMRRAQRCAVERFADRGFDAVTVKEISRRLPTALGSKRFEMVVTAPVHWIRPSSASTA